MRTRAAPPTNSTVVDRFPGTAERMARYEAEAPALAEAACDALGLGG